MRKTIILWIAHVLRVNVNSIIITTNSNREAWLNGWSRNGPIVYLDTMLCCAGCGHQYGVTCGIIHEEFVWPEKDPDWPFDKGACPVCSERE